MLEVLQLVPIISGAVSVLLNTIHRPCVVSFAWRVSPHGKLPFSLLFVLKYICPQ